MNFIRALPWLILMTYYYAIRQPILQRYYDWRGIKYKYSCEGFIEKI